MLTDVRTVVFELRFLPYVFWKESEACSNTEGRPDGLLSRPDGCKLEQKLLDTVKGPDRIPRRLDE